MTKIGATIVADSINEQGDRLTSFLITFPRILLSEINTHRMLSKNTSSSRAIPFAKMVETIQNDPFIPIAWQKEHKGMQGSEYLNAFDSECAKEDWLTAMEYAAEVASNSNRIGVTKQLCNRLLEPFMWTTMLITGPKSGWDNFFKLRCPIYYIEGCDYVSWKDTGLDANTPILERFKVNKGQAEIHMMQLAECIYDAYMESTPKILKAGEWHIPFEDKINIEDLIIKNDYDNIDLWEEALNKDKVKVSVAMAARTSYTVVGEEKALDFEAMIGLHDRLLAWDPPHSSPMEHCSLCVSQEEYDISFKGQEKGWFRNYRGFKSYRQIIEESR